MKRSLILSLLSISTFFHYSHAFSTPYLSLRGIGVSSKAKEDVLTRRRSSSSSENNSHDGGLSAVEAKRVQRFTTGYDKLCKNMSHSTPTARGYTHRDDFRLDEGREKGVDG